MRQNSVFDLVGARRRAGLHRRPVRQVGRAGRARRGRRGLHLPGHDRRAASSSGASSRSSAPPARAVRRAAADRDGLRLRAGRAGRRAGARGGRRGAVRVDVGYYALGGGPTSLSAGTRESLVGVTLGDGHAYRDGRVRDACARPSACARSRVAGRPREAISVGGAEHFGLPAAYPGAARGQRLPRLVRAAGAAAAGGLVRRRVRARVPLATRRDAVRRASARSALVAGPERGHDARAGAPGSPPRPTTPAGDGCSRGPPRGRRRLRVHRVASWPGRRSSRSTGAGALGPVEAFGLERLEAGARAGRAGARAVSAPAPRVSWA